MTAPIDAKPVPKEASAPVKRNEALAPVKRDGASAKRNEASASPKRQVEPSLPRVPLFALAHEVPDKRAGLRAEDVFGPEHLMGHRLKRVEALLGGPGFVGRDEPAIVWRYANGHCFLDVFFYREEGDYIVNHVEARGRTVFRMDARACFHDLLRARATGASD